MNSIKERNLYDSSNEDELERLEDEIASFTVWEKDEAVNIDGFTVQKDFIIFLDKDGDPIGFSSGWAGNNRMSIYFKSTDNKFVLEWTENPIALDALWDNMERNGYTYDDIHDEWVSSDGTYTIDPFSGSVSYFDDDE